MTPKSLDRLKQQAADRAVGFVDGARGGAQRQDVGGSEASRPGSEHRRAHGLHLPLPHGCTRV